ncbi:MAG: PIN domain-containing protein [Spirochaetota bacterium]|nr:PIN domain-containing protein [Spirochaetota bacterium]
MRGELSLVDTNILLTATDRSRPEHTAAREVFLQAPAAGAHLCISGQIIREYVVVATRPVEVNGLGLTSDEAIHNIESFKRRMLFLEETEPVTIELISLVRKYKLSGKAIHDANIIALMHEQNIHMLITQNPDDFADFPDLQIFSPSSFIEAL